MKKKKFGPFDDEWMSYSLAMFTAILSATVSLSGAMQNVNFIALVWLGNLGFGVFLTYYAFCNSAAHHENKMDLLVIDDLVEELDKGEASSVEMERIRQSVGVERFPDECETPEEQLCFILQHAIKRPHNGRKPKRLVYSDSFKVAFGIALFFAIIPLCLLFWNSFQGSNNKIVIDPDVVQVFHTSRFRVGRATRANGTQTRPVNVAFGFVNNGQHDLRIPSYCRLIFPDFYEMEPMVLSLSNMPSTVLKPTEEMNAVYIANGFPDELENVEFEENLANVKTKFQPSHFEFKLKSVLDDQVEITKLVPVLGKKKE